MAVLLSELLNALPRGMILASPQDLSISIQGIVLDSRNVKPGFLFAALTGEHVNGHQFIQSAIQNGAVAVVGNEPQRHIAEKYIQVTDSRLALAYISAAYHGFPGRELTVIGVTGTDGKTTTVNLIYSILKAAGYKAGIVSTVNAIIGDEIRDTGFHVTTPEAPDVQNYLSQMVHHQPEPLTHVVLEATSHGLAQHRVTACEFDLAVYTNITHEHLDYHKTFDAYRDVKAMLIKHLVETVDKNCGNYRRVVLNRDDESCTYLNTLTQKSLPVGSVISYGLDSQADFHPRNVFSSQMGMQFDLSYPGNEIHIATSLWGVHNLSNCLAALTATIGGLGIEGHLAAVGILEMKGVEGRMERIECGQEFMAIVDFAHTPNALKVALETVRNIVPGRVIAVFGSAGLRDREKRQTMAENAAKLADLSIITAEDPRTESLDVILAEMTRGMEANGAVEGKTFWRVPDRREALRLAVNMAQPTDLVIAFGKGHEQSMCFGQIEYPWDDRTALRAAISEYLGILGPDMPYLPI
ncbi:MAG: UDP-N-acetylmuramoyl-L-alanyl-D-glutamate--2,6-diaminopimelate ligase [Anaerolineales bacterium]|nr:UDP-N-acetylmuramoyl-L-alanyl-D-glutamate--2,6-diaminopimelate ligase [Anaerolineales bacterium]